jgi:ferritin-like metal-binding protein YciE
MLTSLQDVLKDHIKDLYSAENQLLTALPKMAEAASSPALTQAFTEHLTETQTHVERLERVAALLGFAPSGKTCKGMSGLVEEGGDVIAEEGSDSGRDAALIAAAQKVEHYEISAYGTAITLAEQLDREDVLTPLQETLDEEKAADQKLTAISTAEVIPALVLLDEEDDKDAEDDEVDADDHGGEAHEVPPTSEQTATM